MMAGCITARTTATKAARVISKQATQAAGKSATMVEDSIGETAAPAVTEAEVTVEAGMAAGANKIP